MWAVDNNAVAGRFGVDPSTLANEFKRAGIQIRPRARMVIA